MGMEKKIGKLSKKIQEMRYLRWACRVIILIAVAVSVWANVLSARDDVASIIISTLPPLIVLLGLEMISRIPIRQDATWAARWSRPIATVVIAGIGAWLSYWSQHAAFLEYSDQDHAILLPIAIDGLMVIASVSLIQLNNWIVTFELEIEELEVRGEAIAVRVNKPKEPTTGAPATVEKEPTKKERVALLWRQYPEWDIKQIAEKAGVRYNYAHGIITALKKAEETVMASSELVPA